MICGEKIQIGPGFNASDCLFAERGRINGRFFKLDLFRQNDSSVSSPLNRSNLTEARHCLGVVASGPVVGNPQHLCRH